MENTAVAGDNKGDKVQRLGDIAHVAQQGKFFIITVNEVAVSRPPPPLFSFFFGGLRMALPAS